MKRVLALLLCLILCVSMAACGGYDEPEKVSTTTPVANGADQETEPVELKDTEAQGFQTVFVLTPDQAEEYYQAIMSGDVSGEGAEFIKSLEENTAKLYLDALANIFGEDVLGTLSSFSGRGLDQVMTEVAYIVSQITTPAEEPDEAPVDDALYEAAMNGTASTLELYLPELDRRVCVEFNMDHVFLAPDWVLMRDESTNYFICLDDYGEVYTLDYRAESASTTELKQRWGAQYANDGNIRVGSVEPFMEGGVEWELFAFVHEQESRGINKETGELEVSVGTVYSFACFARLDSETILQLSTGTFVSEDAFDHYTNLLQTCIRSVTTSVG